MSESTHTTNGYKKHTAAVPRAIIHKKILDAAASDSDASLDEIAAGVSGASVSLVEKVLDEYGDPGVNDQVELENIHSKPEMQDDDSSETRKEAPMDSNESSREQDSRFDPTQLTTKQQQTFREIHRHPDATQAEIGEILDVSGSTICRRLKSIRGFEWSQRHSMVNSVFKDGDMQQKSSDLGTPAHQNLSDQIDELDQQLQCMERQIETQANAKKSVILEPDLIHKIVHACMRSEQISEIEELQILKAFLASMQSHRTG